jgi:GTPase SAR1 family protein
MRLIKNKNVPLDMPSFLVDDSPLGKHLNEHAVLKLFNKYGFMCFCGKPGSGKTSLMTAFLTQKNPKIFKKVFHNVIVCMNPNSRSSLKNNPFEQLDADKVYDELTEDTITEIHKKLEDYSANDEKNLLFIDDMGADLKKSKQVEQTLKKIIWNRRHLHTVVMCSVQSFVSLPLDLRKTISDLFLFKPSKTEFERVFSDILEQPKEVAMELMRFVYTEPHMYLYLYNHDGEQRLFKKWDEIIWKEDNEEESDSESSESDY